MTQTIDLPYCLNCGAAPKTRSADDCSYCGALLPWEQWDEISKARIRVTEAASDKLIRKIESLRESRSPRRRRLRRRPPPLPREAVEQRDLQQLLGRGAFALIALVIVLNLAGRSPFITFMVVVAIGAAVWPFVRSQSKRDTRRRVRTRRKDRERGRVRLDVAVLAVSPPKRIPGTTTHLNRIVTTFGRSGRQRTLIARDGVKVAPGDVGRAGVHGNELVAFKKRGQIEIPSD